MQPLCWVFRILLLSALLPWPSTGQFHVRGPIKPVIALVGEEAVLFCHLDPVMDVQEMEVMWFRSNPSGLVHHYGASQEYQQMPLYQGRTELLKENITKGQMALKIHSIQPLDNGVYRCSFESPIFYNDAQFEVLVTGSGMAPNIHIEPGRTKEVQLTCTSTGWYPEPEVQWRDQQGQRLAPDSEKKKAEKSGLFHVETSVTVNKSSGGSVSCLIRNPVLSEVKEVHISVADVFFSRDYPFTVALAVLLPLLVISTIFGAVYAAVRVRKAKGSLKKKYGELKKEHVELKNDYVVFQKPAVQSPYDMWQNMACLLDRKEQLEREKEELQRKIDEIHKELDQRRDIEVEGQSEV